LVVDGQVRPKSLFQLIQDTQKYSNQNNVIAFSDNSRLIVLQKRRSAVNGVPFFSAIKGFQVNSMVSRNPAAPSQLDWQESMRHLIYTAETHNFPTGNSDLDMCSLPMLSVCRTPVQLLLPRCLPFSWCRHRHWRSYSRCARHWPRLDEIERSTDQSALSLGAHEIAGVAGYSFGNLRLPDYVQPWEDDDAEYPSNFAHPRQVRTVAATHCNSISFRLRFRPVAVLVTTGTSLVSIKLCMKSLFGNRFKNMDKTIRLAGEPLIAGFARSFGQTCAESGARREWVKPIMFSGGIGAIDDQLTAKLPPTKGRPLNDSYLNFAFS
jgi:phosphoribosylformylglycinamidine synthase